MFAVQTLLMFSEDIARAVLNTAAERQVTLIVLGLTGKNFCATFGGKCAGGTDQEHQDSRPASPAGLERRHIGPCPEVEIFNKTFLFVRRDDDIIPTSQGANGRAAEI